MGNKIKIYTKTGDDGTTGLFGGSRVKKDDLRLEAYGTLDELNANLGVIRSLTDDKKANGLLVFIQEKLFELGSVLASDEKGKKLTGNMGCSEKDIELLENAIDEFEMNLPELKNFILPGGGQASSQCHVARTICRRAERRIIALKDNSGLTSADKKFINRLSDFLFILARKFAFDHNQEETFWISK